MRKLILLNFNEIFDYQLGRSAEQDSQIVQAILLLHAQLKTQVQKAAYDKLNNPGKKCYFNLNYFMIELQRKLKTRMDLNQCHNNDIYIYFPMILEGIFMMLGESNKQNKTIKLGKIIVVLMFQYFEIMIDKILMMLHKNQDQQEKKGDIIFKKFVHFLIHNKFISQQRQNYWKYTQIMMCYLLGILFKLQLIYQFQKKNYKILEMYLEIQNMKKMKNKGSIIKKYLRLFIEHSVIIQ